MTIFPNLKEYTQLLPVSMVGLLSGVVSYYGAESRNLKEAFRIVITSMFLTLMVYSILSATDLPYLARVGISAFIGYFGVDKAIELVQNILAFRNNNNKKWRFIMGAEALVIGLIIIGFITYLAN